MENSMVVRCKARLVFQKVDNIEPGSMETQGDMETLHVTSSLRVSDWLDEARPSGGHLAYSEHNPTRQN